MTTTRITLSRATLARAKAQDKPFRLWDARVPGLFLRVQPSGATTWNVQWSRASSMSLGRYPVMTLDAARKQALVVLGDAATNGTPAAARRKTQHLNLRSFLRNEYLPWAKTQHKTAEANCARVETVFADLLERPLREITSFVIEKGRAKRLDSGVAPSTCNRDLAALRAVIMKAIRWGFLQENPFAAIKASKVDSAGVVRYLDGNEEVRLRGALIARDADLRATRASYNQWRTDRGLEPLPVIAGDGFGDYLTPLVLVAINTGLRRGELLSLTWNDVDLVGKRVTVRAAYAKNGKARHVPLNSEALNALKLWRAQTDLDDPVFPVADPKKAWAAILKKAEVSNFRFHDLRHHFASRLVMAGVDLNTVRELLGHADLKMTLRYAHLAPEHKAEAVERLTIATPSTTQAAHGESAR
jgi:integrase